MKHLYVARHGLSEMNVRGVWSGTIETPLTPEGREQAKLAGESAKNLDIDYIVCSPLSRAHETAQIIARQLNYPEADIHVNSMFIERHYGELEGQPWNPDFNLDDVTDIETVDTLLERARLALNWLEQLPADNVLVVSHGSFGRALRSLVLVELPFSHQQRINNAEIIKLL